MSNSCPNCSFEGERLSTHWNLSEDCSYPEMSGRKMDVLKGIVMGDGSVDRTSTNPRISCSNINRQYLDYLDNLFGCISVGVGLENSAEECARRDRKTGFNRDASPEDYSDIYRWRTRTHPEFSRFADWYTSGDKRYPDDIELSEEVLKHWYVCDGCYNDKNFDEYIEIGISNEVNNTSKIKDMFSNSDLPVPKVDNSTRKDGSTNTSVRWSVDQSDELLCYMGEPVPGFEYKWGGY